MAYVTLEEKIETLATLGEDPISLPLEMLAAVAGGTPLAYIVDTAPYSAKDMIDVYALENATGFFVEFRWEHEDVRRFCYVTFRNVQKKVHVHLDDSDFFNTDLIDRAWTTDYFHRLKPGDLAICAYPKIYLLEKFSELMESGYERAKWDHTLDEGSLVTVVDTWLIDKFPFVRVIYRGRIYWSFGCLVRFEDFQQENANHNHHFI